MRSGRGVKAQPPPAPPSIPAKEKAGPTHTGVPSGAGAQLPSLGGQAAWAQRTTQRPVPSGSVTTQAAPDGQPSRRVTGAQIDWLGSQRQPLSQWPAPVASLTQLSGVQQSRLQSAPSAHGSSLQPAASAIPTSSPSPRRTRGCSQARSRPSTAARPNLCYGPGMRRRLALLLLPLAIALWLLRPHAPVARPLHLHFGAHAAAVREVDLIFQREGHVVRDVALQFPSGARADEEREVRLPRGTSDVGVRMVLADGRELHLGRAIAAEGDVDLDLAVP